MKWNVKDINVFTELSADMSKTVGMVDDIRQEVDDVLTAAENACEDAKSTIASKQGTLETEIAQLEDDIEGMRAKMRADETRRLEKETSDAEGEDESDEDEEEKPDSEEPSSTPEPEDVELEELYERLAKAKGKQDSLSSAAKSIGEVREAIDEKRRLYEQSFLRARDEYEENVSNICKLLGSIRENLEKSL